MSTLRHPDHDAVAQTVRSWYTESDPAMGYLRERRRFGVYSRNVHLPFMNGVTVHDLTRGQVPEFLEDVRRYFGGASVAIAMDDPQQDQEIGPTLVAAGLERGPAFLHLAHVGVIPDAPPVAGMTIEPLTFQNLEAFSVAKLKGFAGDEAEPSPERVADEVAFHRVEMAGEKRGLLARLEGEVGTPAPTVAILGYYEGWDRDVSILTTRVPFRERGIARQLLCHLLANAHEQGCRSVVIGADPEDTPIQLYRRLGFNDDVYWTRGYRILTFPLGQAVS